MNPKINRLKNVFTLAFCMVFTFVIWAQGDTSKIKAQLAFGVNSPSSNGFVQNFQGESINFPTVNLGAQYMFKQNFGAKLDYGFNRISNAAISSEFKLNYARINLQVVYDASRIIKISHRMGTFFHAGPGFSMIKPLGNYGNNSTSFLNTMAGVELHYGVSDSLTLYFDTSYILGFSKDFMPASDGFGAFNGNLLTITFGVSISLSGCYFCGD